MFRFFWNRQFTGKMFLYISICLKNERTSLTESSDSSTSNLSTIFPNSNQTAGTEGNLKNSVALKTDSTAVNVNTCENKVVLLQAAKTYVSNLNETKKSAFFCCSVQGIRGSFWTKMWKLFSLKSIRKEKLLINIFSEKSSFLKEFDIVKIKHTRFHNWGSFYSICLYCPL